MREREAGYANAVSVPAEEIYVEEKEPVLPLKSAADLSLANFSEASLYEIPSLDIPFSDVAIEGKAKRSKYITLDRIIRYGATDGCRACTFESTYSKHTPRCRARFNGLIRADRIASSRGEGSKTPVSTSETPVPKTPAPEEVEEFVGVPPEELPFSAGVPPDHAATVIRSLS